LFLKLLLNWPLSLLTWDILFLLPVPWVGPVVAPVLVSIAMIVCGLILLRREYAGRPVHLTPSRWGLILLGGVIIVVAMAWDFRNTSSGGYPNPFNWPLFAIGLAIGLGAFLSSLRYRPLPS
jgi:hypothetical protein